MAGRPGRRTRALRHRSGGRRAGGRSSPGARWPGPLPSRTGAAGARRPPCPRARWRRRARRARLDAPGARRSAVGDARERRRGPRSPADDLARTGGSSSSSRSVDGEARNQVGSATARAGTTTRPRRARLERAPAATRRSPPTGAGSPTSGRSTGRTRPRSSSSSGATGGVRAPAAPPDRNRYPDQPALSGDGRFLAVRARGLEGDRDPAPRPGQRRPGRSSRSTSTGGRRRSPAAIAAQPAISWRRPLRRLHGRRPGRASSSHGPKPSNRVPPGLPARPAAGDTILVSRSARPARSGRAARSRPRSAATARSSPSRAAPATSSPTTRTRQSTSSPGRARPAAVELVSRSTAGAGGELRSGFPAVTGDGGAGGLRVRRHDARARRHDRGPPRCRAVSDLATPSSGRASPPSPATSSSAIAAPAAPRASRSAATTRARRTGSARTRRSRRRAATSPSRPRPTTSSRVEANKARDVYVRDPPAAGRGGAEPDRLRLRPARVAGHARGRPRSAAPASSPARIGAITIGGANAADFVVAANPCSGRTLAPGRFLRASRCSSSERRRASGRRRCQIAERRRQAGRPAPRRRGRGPEADRRAEERARRASSSSRPAPASRRTPRSPCAGPSAITATPLEPIVSDATGAFTAQVLVLPRDRVGRADAAGSRHGARR